MNEKVGPGHLQRKAVLYVRQSSPHQVVHNQESRRLQLAMRDRLVELGWLEIEIIDEDLGRTASGVVARSGFERLVAEVSLGHVGGVAARELSRFARNSRDWQQLIEVCRIVDTVLIDQESVYDARRSNDRLLLGLKGSLNEYELDLLRQRGLEARREKAQRGELILPPPIGYLAGERGYEMDPDRRVQQAIRQVFDKFLEVGTVRQVLFWFVEHDLQLPTRRSVNGTWQTVWRRPNYGAIYSMLTHPIYGGAYVYGKTQQAIRWVNGTPRRHIKTLPHDQPMVLLPQRHEGYVVWDEFQRIQKLIANNNSMKADQGTGGAARNGVALLSGLLRCRRCGHKLIVNYTGKAHEILRYSCFRSSLDNGEPRCISFGGTLIDELVGREVLQVLRPTAIEAALQGAQGQTQMQNQVQAALELELKAARYAAERAEQQYELADPKNRLVAAELESRWNRALQRIVDLEERIALEQSRSSGPTLPSVSELGDLAAEVERIWDHPQTDMRLKKRIVRTLIEEVIVDVNPEVGEIPVVIHWKGGVHTELKVPRRRRGQNRRHTSMSMVEAIEVLTRINSDEQIAGWLTQNDLRTGSGKFWTKEAVTSLRSYRHFPNHSPERQRSEGWMTLTQAAAFLGITAKTLRRAVEQQEIPAAHPLARGPWVFRRADLETPQAKLLVERVRNRDRWGTGPNPGQMDLSLSTT